MQTSEARKKNIVHSTITLIEGKVIKIIPATPAPMEDWVFRFTEGVK